MTILLFILPFSGRGSNSLCEVFFTRPGSRMCPVTDRLCRLIDNSKTSIDAALYDLDNRRVLSALERALMRGIKVRLVMEADNYYRRDMLQLEKGGTGIRLDKKRGLMHHKFFIFDRSLTWTGSFNVTENGSRKNNNNAILFRMPALAEIYRAEFEEMYVGGEFGNRRERRPLPWLKRNNVVAREGLRVTALFSPEDDVEGILLRLIEKAVKSIRFMAFSFTSDRLGEAIIRKKREGVELQGLMESHGSFSAYSEYMKLIVEGIDVRRDSNTHLMHHKVIIIDDRIVIAGSYNFSRGAGIRNDENLLIIEGRGPARCYLGEFNRLFRKGLSFRRKK